MNLNISGTYPAFAAYNHRIDSSNKLTFLSTRWNPGDYYSTSTGTLYYVSLPTRLVNQIFFHHKGSNKLERLNLRDKFVMQINAIDAI